MIAPLLVATVCLSSQPQHTRPSKTRPLPATVYGRVVDKTDLEGVQPNWYIAVSVPFDDPPKLWWPKPGNQVHDVYCQPVNCVKPTAIIRAYRVGYMPGSVTVSKPDNANETVSAPHIYIVKINDAWQDLPHTPGGLKEQLLKEMDIARQAHLVNQFQYFLLQLKAAYHQMARRQKIGEEFVRAIDELQQTTSNETTKTYQDVAEINANPNDAHTEVTNDQKTKMMRLAFDQPPFAGTFPGIRAEAMRALALVAESLGESDKDVFLDNLQKLTKKSNELLFRPAKTALFIAAKRLKRADILADAPTDIDPKNGDRELALATIIAIGEARLTPFEQALRQLQSRITPESDMELTAALRRSLALLVAPADTGVIKPPDDISTESPKVGRDGQFLISYMMKDGAIPRGYQLQANVAGVPTTKHDEWFHPATDGLDRVLQIDYPGNPQYGFFNILVQDPQPNQPPALSDFQGFPYAVMEIRATKPGVPVILSIIAEVNTRDGGRSSNNIEHVITAPTEWTKYRLRVPQTLDSAYFGLTGPIRTLEIAPSVYFRGPQKRTILVRQVYFTTNPNDGKSITDTQPVP